VEFCGRVVIEELNGFVGENMVLFFLNSRVKIESFYGNSFGKG